MMRTLIRRSLLRILALIKKEILTILMDKKSRAVLFAPIIVQSIDEYFHQQEFVQSF